MASCELTGKKVASANNVSHANNHTKRKQYPNVQGKRIYVPELDRFVRLKLSTRAIRTVTKLGLRAYAKKLGLDFNKLTQA
jgi:large subunit ribosomal protein L28